MGERPRPEARVGHHVQPMTAILPPARARAARFAVGTLFLANGALGASVLPRLPAIRDALGLSNAELGAAVAAMPIGGLLVGGFVGLVIARFGSGRAATVAAVAYTLGLAALGLASSWATLAGAFLVLGVFDATMDAAMNAHGFGLQRVHGRSVMQGFHGMWSAGGMAGGAVGAVAAALAVPVTVHLAVVAVAVVVLVLVGSRRMLPDGVTDGPHPARAGVAVAAVRIHPRNARHLLLVLGPIALLGVLCTVLQGAAATWGAVYLTDVLHTSAGMAAVAFVVYMAAMTLGRLTNDRWVDRFGGMRMVRAGALVGASGVATAIIAGALGLVPLAFVGFAAIGIGSSPMFPVLVTAAGSRPGIPSGYGVAIVSWLVRIGLAIAPAIVGLTADAAGLATAFLIPLAATLAIAVLAVPLTGGRVVRAVAVEQVGT